MMSLENDQQKVRNLKSFQPFLSPFSHWHVEGLSTQRVTLKADVTGPENMLLAGMSLHLSARKFYRLGSEGVNCEGRNKSQNTVHGGRPGLSFLTSLLVSVDVKIY